MRNSKDEQKNFLYTDGMPLEHFACEMFGRKFQDSASETKITGWKKLYIDCLTLIANSFDRSVGSVDRYHRGEILAAIKAISEKIRDSIRKDDIHMWLIIGLFTLVFLLLGNVPRRMDPRIKRHPKSFNFSGFRTLSYSQSIEQFGFLLQSRIERNSQSFGFEDWFEARMAYEDWANRQRNNKQASTYVDWVRVKFPKFYFEMK